MTTPTVKLATNDKAKWTERITRWANRQHNLFYLSSCSQQDAGNLGSYELVVAQGIKKKYVANNPAEMDWNALKEFCDHGEWTFFVLSYDLNRSLISGLTGEQDDALGWPLLYLIEPERVITLSRAGELEVFGDDSENLVQQLRAPAASVADEVVNVSYGRFIESISREDYLGKVAHIKEQIAAGDFYEINLCVETVIEDIAISNPFAFHQELLTLSPAPFSSYVQLQAMHLLAASPERFLKKDGKKIYSQPIKGTSARHADPSQDEASKEYLACSIKERAEHVMIVDLMRNDLSQLCQAGSITVSELCGIYGYRQVFQMISTIVGDCRDKLNFIDVLRATFPMGSMTGAPKNNVMKHIEQIEPASRGWFSGSVGYIKPSGDFDSNVVIRGILYDERQHRAKYSVGGAITFDSDPEAEHRECLLKGQAIRQLFDEYKNVDR